MIDEERLAVFLSSLDRGNPPFLEQIEREASRNGEPIIRTQTQGLLRFLLALHKPMSILEVGCAVGFSALFMSEYAPAGCRITTIEKVKRRIETARENIKKAGREETITVLAGDAADLLPELTGPYDMIFMDAAKGQYPNFLPDVLRLLTPGGLLVSDNVLQDGDILESRFAVERRDRTIHSRMRQYLFELTHDDALTTTVLPVGDGVTLTTKCC
ncbi:MAG: O-methyltransferase [Bacteroidales bacterium]|nr:O-methyltransferase [Bacteroidales bacterium]MCM1414794.1 O-methyltransferase [bacterium]MCM1423200.1 O-methyltransferase [bacterium]